jgi:hypothetical protein
LPSVWSASDTVGDLLRPDQSEQSGMAGVAGSARGRARRRERARCWTLECMPPSIRTAHATLLEDDDRDRLVDHRQLPTRRAIAAT